MNITLKQLHEKEAIELAEQGFGHWRTINGLHIFRKAKY